MSDTQDRSSKTEAPTGRRLQQAREEGQVAKSPEVASTFAFAAASVTVLIAGGSIARDIGGRLMPFIAHPDAIDLTNEGAVAVMHAALMAVAPIAMVVGAAAAAGAAGNLIQTGFMFTPKSIAPDFSKVGFGSGLKRLFGVDNVISFAKSLAKLVAMAAVVVAVLKPHVQSLEQLSWLDPSAVLPVAADILRAVVIAAIAVFGISAGADYFIQRQRHISRLRMSREDIKQETKDSEGDPHLKAKIKQMRLAKAKRRMIQNVPKATLVIMNPTHYAVALRYVQGETAAPICMAKGVDDIALKIREIAEQHRIAVVEDPPLARALYAVIDVDETIPREHYQAVAKIVGFVMGKANRRARPLRAAS